MSNSEREFSRLVGALLTRFLIQNGRAAPSDAARDGFGGRLWALVVVRGLPRVPAPGEGGVAGGMAEEEIAPLVARVLNGADDPLIASAVKQLVKACLYPEFTVCRDSFREVGPDGTCRRQDLKRALGRVSGSHCVDCPHWVALAPAQHEDYLAREWKGDAAEFTRHRDVFLPEDFRALRRWQRVAARTATGP